MVKIRYHCKICQQDYATEAEAKECEGGHQKIAVINRKKLIKAVSQVYPCVKRNTAHETALECILFEIKDSLLTLVAADGFILGTSSLEVSLPAGAGLMHCSEVKEFKKKLGQAKEVKLKVGNGLVFLIKGHGKEEEIALNMKDLTFPDWQKVFPVDSAEIKTRVVFQSKAMEEALWKVQHAGNLPVKLYIEREEIRLAGEGAGGIFSRESIPAKTVGEDTKQAFSWLNLLKMVKTLRGEITLSTNGYSQTALFEQGRARWLIMPVFCQW